jgi:hypothetical protein
MTCITPGFRDEPRTTENGFAWVAYDNNLIGYWATWIKAKPFYWEPRVVRK